MLTLVQKLAAHEGACWSVLWSPDNKWLVTSGQDKLIRLWQEDFGILQCINVANENQTVHTRTIRRVAWRADSMYLSAASFDSTSSIWRLTPESRLELVTRISGQENEVKGICFSPCGDMLATCSRDKSIWIFDVSPILTVRPRAGSESSDYQRVSVGDGNGAHSEDNEFVFPASPTVNRDDPSLPRFGAEEVECLAVLQGHSQDVKSIRFNPLDGQMLVSVSYDDTIKIWRSTSPDDWQLVETLKGHTNTVWEVAFNPESKSEFATVSADGSLKVWSDKRMTPTISPSQSYLLAGPIGLSTRRFNQSLVPSAETGWSCQTVQVTTSQVPGIDPQPVYCVDWTVFGLIAVGCGDNTVRLFLRQGSSVIPLSTIKTDAEPNSVSFRPRIPDAEHTQLAVALDDGSVTVFSVRDSDVVNFA